MAVAAHNTSVASLMQRALERQATLARTRFKLERNQVRDHLKKLQQNNVVPYKELVNILRDWPLTDENFKVLIEDCRENVMLLGMEARGLVEAACGAEWAGREAALVQLYTSFCLDLVAAHNYHCPLLLTALIKQFKVDGEIWEEEPPTELEDRWSNVHSIIAQIVAFMPMSSDLLLQAIIEQYPYFKAGSFINRSYVHNLIWITKYIPSLLEQIMTVILTRMIVMDVSCSENLKQKAKSEDTFSMEIDSEEGPVEESLDHCMWEALRWLQQERSEALNSMCSVFERVVLPTHGTRHVQFLLLYTISISQQCADRVLDSLWVVAAGLHALGPGAVATRRAAAAHLAGLLARCVRVPNTRLTKYLRLMADWCHNYIKATQESMAPMTDSINIHGAFYAVCHALFYLVAFKHHELFVSKESINFVESLNLPRMVTCNLNPLRSCPPAVTRAFSSVTRAHQVVYCQAVIEKNARYTLNSRREVDFDHWFPYDPYSLPRSGKLVWPLCVEYKDWLNEDGDKTQYSSRIKKMDTEEDDFLSTSPSFKLASSLSNCISPGFKYM